MLIYGRDREIAAWVGYRLGIFDFGPSTAIGVVRGGEIVAGAVFHQYRHPAIEITFASTTPRWATRDTIRAILRYPFLQLNCRRISAVSPEGNVAAAEFMQRLGFVREGFHPEALPSGAAVSFGLLRTAAERWL